MIAISYRREDSSPAAGRLYDRLQAEFGKGNVFMDFDSIPYGVDFREKIKQALEGAQVVIAVIGPGWMGGRGRGKRRINDPADFVRIEIAHALLRGIPVIPVLLDNTVMPKVESLPEDIRGLAYRNALTLDTGLDFHHHANRLISGIRKVVVMPSAVLADPPQPADSTEDVQPRGLSPPPLTASPKPAFNRQMTKMIIGFAVVLLAVVTLVALWSIVSFIGRAISEKRDSDSDNRPSTSVTPMVSNSPSSITTTFKAETPLPVPSPARSSPTPTVEPTTTATVAATATAAATSPPRPAAMVAHDKEFVDKYKAAYEKGDKATLESFLYTKDANPMALEFYKMMQSEGAGTAKISKIKLVDLTPEDVKKASEVLTGPDGSKAQLPLKPTKKLKISIETKDGNGSSTSSSENFVAEKDGKYVIPVPATVK